MNSDDLNSTQPPPSPPTLQTNPPTSSSNDLSEAWHSPTFDPNSIDWKEAPLDMVMFLNGSPLVHEMEPPVLLAYVKRCSELRQNHHAQGAALRREATELGAEKKEKKTKAKKEGVALAEELFKSLGL
jgi:hypothetical protein